MKKFFFLVCAALALVACTDKPEPTPKAALSISPMVNYIECGAQDVELAIKSTDSWTAELTGWSNKKETEWATLNAEGGDGDFTLVVSVQNSTSLTEERFVFVTVKTASKTVEAKLTQKTLTLGEGEVLITDLDGISRIWSAYNLAGNGKFTTDVQAVGAVFQFNSNTAWPWDPSKNNGAFGGEAPSADGMVPVEGFADAVKAYQTIGSHKAYNADNKAINDNYAWEEANDPCPEGWRVPSSLELIRTIGYSDTNNATMVDPTVNNFNGVRINAGQYGFTTNGFVVGFGKANLPEDLTPQNITAKGGIFIPQSGWLGKGGYCDRTWLMCLWAATSHNDDMAGLYLSNWTNYCDHWGNGDGHKYFAAPVRCVKK